MGISQLIFWLIKLCIHLLLLPQDKVLEVELQDGNLKALDTHYQNSPQKCWNNLHSHPYLWLFFLHHFTLYSQYILEATIFSNKKKKKKIPELPNSGSQLRIFGKHTLISNTNNVLHQFCFKPVLSLVTIQINKANRVLILHQDVSET